MGRLSMLFTGVMPLIGMSFHGITPGKYLIWINSIISYYQKCINLVIWQKTTIFTFMQTNNIVFSTRKELIMIMPTGQRAYRFSPWESKVTLVDDYIYLDVPILDYLRKLQKDGENPDEYKSI